MDRMDVGWDANPNILTTARPTAQMQGQATDVITETNSSSPGVTLPITLGTAQE
jgi:hypothetical protein